MAAGCLAAGPLTALGSGTAWAAPTDWTLSVLAGNGTRGLPNGSGAATSSPVGSGIGAVAVDGAGNRYLADADRGAVLKVDAAGDISIVAGTGTRGAYAFSATPTSAVLAGPRGVAVRGGDVYFSDSDRVLKVSGGVLSLVVGGGGSVPTTTAAPATSVSLSQPGQLAFDDQGDLFVSEETGNRVLELTSAGVTVVAGSGGTTPSSGPSIGATTAQLNYPRGLAFDSSGDLYVSNSLQNQVLKVTTGGQLSVIASGLNRPYGLAIDDQGVLYVADYTSLKVKTLSMGVGTAVAGNGNGFPFGSTPVPGPALSSPMAPAGLAVDADRRLYVGDVLSPYAYEVAAPTPVRPSAVTATAGNATAAVSWTAPSSPGSSAISGYVVTPVDNGVDQAPQTFAGTSTSQTVTGLTNGHPYTFRVAATNTAGTGPVATSTSAVTPSAVTAPGAPTAVTATAGNASASVTWTAPASTGGASITGYVVTPYLGGAAQAAQAFGTPSTTQNITGLTNGQTYTFRVAATNSAGTGSVGTSNAVTPTAPASGGGGASSLLPQSVALTGPGSVPLTSGTARVSAVASAGGALSYSSSDASVATVDGGGVLTLTGVGSTTVTAFAAATATHSSASASTTVTVTAAPSTSLPEGVTRLAGPDRVATSVAVSKEVFADPEAGKSANVVIATSAKFADSIAGTRLAGQVQGPLLLTGTDELDGKVASEVRRLVRKGGTVYILGQEKALSATVKSALASLSTDYPIERVGGADRYETAAAIADEVTSQTGDVGPIYVVTGTDFADGVSVGAYAQRTGGVVLLTAGAQLPAVTAEYLRDHDPKGDRAVAVGGRAAEALARGGFTAAANRAVVGEDRYETSALLADRYSELKTAANASGKVVNVGIAGGASWPDALAGSAAMSHLDGPLLLTPTGSGQLAAPTAEALRDLSSKADRAVVFGGDAAVSDAALSQVKGIIAG